MFGRKRKARVELVTELTVIKYRELRGMDVAAATAAFETKLQSIKPGERQTITEVAKYLVTVAGVALGSGVPAAIALGAFRRAARTKGFNDLEALDLALALVEPAVGGV